MLNSTTIGQINRALENSFSAIKRDINELRLSINTQLDQILTIRQNLEKIKEETVTKDKVNVLKIKVGEINEDIKKLWELEKQVKELSHPTINKKKISESLDELNAKLISLDVKIAQVNKNAASESQLKEVVSQINNELNNISLDVKRRAMQLEQNQKNNLEEYASKMNNRIQDVNDAIADLRKEVAKKDVEKKDISNIYTEIDQGNERIKKELLAVAKRNKEYIKENEVRSLLDNINEEFDGISNEINSLKTQIKQKNTNYVTVKQIKDLIDEISDEFSELRSEIKEVPKTNSKKEIEGMKKSLDSFKSRIKEIDKQVGKLGNKEESEDYGASVILKNYEPAKREKYKSKNSFVLGNIFIFLSFVFLITSIVAFYFTYESLTDWFAVGAVLSFLIGMLLRIIAVLKTK